MAEVAPLTKLLEKGNFIEKNPGPLSSNFRLAFNGQLFAEQLKTLYPEIRKLLGNKSLIKPIKIKK